MPAYLLHGFRWHRPEIRVYVVLANVDDASPDWVMGPATSAAIVDSFREVMPVLEEEGVNLRLVEQHDESDTGRTAVAQPYAFVADQFIRVGLSVDVEEAMRIATGAMEGEGGGVEATLNKGDRASVPDEGDLNDPSSEAAKRKRRDAAFALLRDGIQTGEKIGWYIVWCGDEVRWVNREGMIDPVQLEDLKEDEDEDDEGEDEDEGEEEEETSEESSDARSDTAPATS
ncbi:MAG: Transcription initiation protein spt3 [Chaenotheca gracillima]|nr:MAG: Transcription initiation protein spt3 [Chaenotheca gracillima]